MGVEGEDFISNPIQNTEYTDDELEIDDNPEVIFGYMGDGDDYIDLEADDDDDDDDLDDVDDVESDDFSLDEHDTFHYIPHEGFVDLDFRDDFLTDEGEDSDGDLRGVMVNGVFIQSGGEAFNRQLQAMARQSQPAVEDASNDSTSSTAATTGSNNSAAQEASAGGKVVIGNGNEDESQAEKVATSVQMEQESGQDVSTPGS